MSEPEKRVLSVGLACLDIINVCSKYPEEDSDQRTLEYYWQRGGNAANASTVVALLGAKSEFMGTMAEDYEMRFLKEDFASYGVFTNNCIVKKGCSTSTSVIIINQENGSRTILHTGKNLPELTFDEFSTLDLAKYKWIQMEGRPGFNAIKRMLQYVDEYNRTQTSENKIITGVELEKANRPELDLLLGIADYVFVSKEYCTSHGYNSKEEAVDVLIQKCRQGATIICPWGEQGAVAKSKDGQMYSSPAFPPEKLKDTLGAGDTFVAATIVAIIRGMCIQDAITVGCRVAGAKCGMMGNKALKDIKFF